MKKVFFTSTDGEVWVNKAHLKEIIRKESKAIHHRSTPQRLGDILIGYLNTLYYKEERGDIQVGDPDTDYFYCGSCRRGFPVRYTPEMIRSDIRPCPTCGAQSNVTTKLGIEEEGCQETPKESQKS